MLANRRAFFWKWGGGFLLAYAVVVVSCSDFSRKKDRETTGMPVTHDPERLALIGPNSCRECHAAEVAEWERSHHALANRRIDHQIDRVRFSPERTIVKGDVEYRVFQTSEGFFIEVKEADGTVTGGKVEGVLAYDPMQQYLIPFGDGSWQTTNLAWDVHENEWFDVFGPGPEDTPRVHYHGDAHRLPGDWGHWTGRAMNWNANCASCHMTEYEKGYDPIEDTYHSRWLQHGIACVQCHTGLEDHVATATQTDGGILPIEHEMELVLDSCRSCHSHRGALTPDDFRIGERFHDHYHLSLPDQPGLYHPDGQILDEVFVTGSFKMSSKGHAGISCMECHNAHTLELTMPLENNSLCMHCHSGGLMDAPIIEPVQHSFHEEGSPGNSCVECHMPHSVYMARDPRRDHGFLSPDPLLTRELGIPNACSDCHKEEGLDWVIDAAEEWYGERLAESPQRRRARLLHAIYEGADDEETGRALLAKAKKEENDAWRATYTGLLMPFLYLPEVQEYARKAAEDPSPLVRTRSANLLSYLPDQGGTLNDLLEDEYRVVRLQAGRLLSADMDPGGVLGEEWEDYLRHNGDYVSGAFLLAEQARRKGDREMAHSYILHATRLDANSPDVAHQAAILLSRLGDDAESERVLRRALRIEPEHAGLLYSLALLVADQGKADEAVDLLLRATDADPQHYRAWLNLSIILAQQQRYDLSAGALRRASPGLRQSPQWQQMQQYLRQHGEMVQ